MDQRPRAALLRRSSRPILVVFLGVLLVALTACGINVSRAATADSLHLVAFAGAKAVNQPAATAWSTATDDDVAWLTSYGASGDQSRSVRDGLPADVVHLSLTGDMERLVDSGVVAADWAVGPQHGIATRSVVVLVVREGNPKNITGWADLASDNVSIITPNPGSSGAARWNILAAAGGFHHDNGGDEEEFLTRLLANVAALPGSGRDATTAFLSGSADVLISQEQEAIFARQNGAEIDYVIPPTTLLVENPAAVTVQGDPRAADYLDFLFSAPGQLTAAQAGFRPDPAVELPAALQIPGANDSHAPFPQVSHLLTVTGDFGGWDSANDTYFGNAGLITRIQQQRGRS